MDNSDIASSPIGRFEYTKYDENQKTIDAEIRNDAMGMAALLEDNLIPSRELSLALTKLEEVVMWAGKALRYGVKT